MGASIMVGVDGSPAARQAVAWAAQQALESGVTVLAVHVLTYSAEFRRDLPPTGLTTWRKNLRHLLEHEWVQPARDAGVPIRTVLVEAESVDGGLVQLAADHKPALVVLGARSHGDLKNRIFGGVTYKVSHRANRPVVIVPCGPPRHP